MNAVCNRSYSAINFSGRPSDLQSDTLFVGLDVFYYIVEFLRFVSDLIRHGFLQKVLKIQSNSEILFVISFCANIASRRPLLFSTDINNYFFQKGAPLSEPLKSIELFPPALAGKSGFPIFAGIITVSWVFFQNKHFVFCNALLTKLRKVKHSDGCWTPGFLPLTLF